MALYKSAYYYYYIIIIIITVPSSRRERLAIDDIALVLQQNRLRWYGHVLRKDDDD